MKPAVTRKPKENRQMSWGRILFDFFISCSLLYWFYVEETWGWFAILCLVLGIPGLLIGFRNVLIRLFPDEMMSAVASGEMEELQAHWKAFNETVVVQYQKDPDKDPTLYREEYKKLIDRLNEFQTTIDTLAEEAPDAENLTEIYQTIENLRKRLAKVSPHALFGTDAPAVEAASEGDGS